ncbi:hypothetical protein IJT93_09270, partial [bacterium]|nr:hypothetical protein [bacterium]
LDQGKTCFMGVRGIVRFLRFPHVPIIKACIEKGPAKKDFSFFHSPFFDGGMKTPLSGLMKE